MTKPDKGNGNYKVSIKAPEEIKKETPYTLSVNPDDDHQYWHSDERIKNSVRWMQQTINLIKAKIILHMEISRNGRLHYHGTITFANEKDIQRFYVLSLHSLLNKSTIEIDDISDSSCWDTYCTKSKHIIDVMVKTSDQAWKKLNQLQYVGEIGYKDITEY